MLGPKAVATLVAVLIVSGLPGCATLGVTAYGDSLIATDTAWQAAQYPADIVAKTGGDELKSALVAGNTTDLTVNANGWFGQIGGTLYNHANFDQTARTPVLDARSGVPQVVLYSMGTNDAAAHVTGAGGSDLDGTKALAQTWIDAAYAQGVKCVVWLKPQNVNNYLNSSTQQVRDAYKNYIDGFTAWLATKEGTRFRVLDWPQLLAQDRTRSFDGLHPSASGGTAIGTQLRVLSSQCGV